MHDFEFWNQVLVYIQYGGLITSVILNTFLILLIIFRSPSQFGAYKYLMIYISLFQTAYSILATVVEPKVFSYESAFMCFRYFKHSYFGRVESFYLIVLYCGSFGFSLAILAVHFVYRYGAVDNIFRKKWIAGRKLIFLFLLPVAYGAWWSVIVFYTCKPSHQTDSLMRIPLLASLDTRIEDVGYVIGVFYFTDQQNHIIPNAKMLIGAVCMFFMTQTSLYCVLNYGFKCYRKITTSLARTSMASSFTRSIQKQLFQALVIQTLIPLVLMYLPFTVLIVLPVIFCPSAWVGLIATATIAIYPAIDPLPTIFIIKAYRETLLCDSCCHEIPANENLQLRKTVGTVAN